MESTLYKKTGSENSMYIKFVGVIVWIENAGGMFSLQVVFGFLHSNPYSRPQI